MFIKEIPYNYNSLKQLNANNNKSKIYKKFKNSRSKIPFQTTFHNYNYNSISRMNNYNTSNGRDTFYSNYSMSNNKNGRIQSLEQLSIDKNRPKMNIMINNKIIKNIFVNKNPKYKILNRNNNIISNNTKRIQNPINNFYNNINKIKKKLYNDYNLTYQNINEYNNTNNNNKNYSNINSASKNIKTFAYKNFSGKKLLKSDNKKKQIPIQKNYYSNNKNLNINTQRGNSYGFNNNITNNNIIYENYNRNNKIMNQNRKNIKLYQASNYYSKTNIYETEYNNIRDQINLNYNNINISNNNNNNIPSKISYTKIKSNNNNNANRISKHKSFNEQMILYNKGPYQKTEINNVNINNKNLISSSSSSDISNELSLIAEDIVKIYKKQKIIKKEKNDGKNISKNLEEDFNKSLKKNNVDDSTVENFDLIDEIINKADLEEKNKKNRKIKFDLEKNIFIKYNPEEKLLLDNKKMEFYFTLLKSKIKFNPVIKNFDKNEIRINKDYIQCENLEEYEILGDLYNIFYLKDINDLDKKLKNNIDNLMNKA